MLLQKIQEDHKHISRNFDLSVNLTLNYSFIFLYTLSLFSAHGNYGVNLLDLQLHVLHRPQPALKA